MKLQRRKTGKRKVGNYFSIVEGKRVPLQTEDRALAAKRLREYLTGNWAPEQRQILPPTSDAPDVAHAPTEDESIRQGASTGEVGSFDEQGHSGKIGDDIAAAVLGGAAPQSESEAPREDGPPQWWALIGCETQDKGLDAAAGLLVGLLLKATEIAARYAAKRTVGEPSEALVKMQTTTARLYLATQIPKLTEGGALDPGQALLIATGLQAAVMISAGERLQVVKKDRETPEERAANVAASGA